MMRLWRKFSPEAHRAASWCAGHGAISEDILGFYRAPWDPVEAAWTPEEKDTRPGGLIGLLQPPPAASFRAAKDEIKLHSAAFERLVILYQIKFRGWRWLRKWAVITLALVGFSYLSLVGQHALERIIGRNSGGVPAFIIFIAGALVIYNKAQEEEKTETARVEFENAYEDGLEGRLKEVTRKGYEQAAVHGKPGAQFGLGLMYQTGDGVPQDYVLAHMWYSLAAAQGNADADRMRDRLAGLMKPDQLAEAQRMAREWKLAPEPRSTKGKMPWTNKGHRSHLAFAMLGT